MDTLIGYSLSIALMFSLAVGVYYGFKTLRLV